MAAARFNLTLVAGRIIKLLGSEETIMKHIGSLSGAHQEILMKLKETIQDRALVLLDADKKSWHDNYVSDWMMELEEALCDAENLVDELSTEALRRSLMKTTGNQMANQVRNYFMSSLAPNMSKDIQKIRRRLEEIAVEGRDFHLEELSEKQVIMKPEKHSVDVVKEEVLFRDYKQEILETLLNPNRSKKSIDVLPIVGIGGIGKTALAKQVFNDEMVRVHFKLRIWVTVGEIFDVRQILTAILVRATNQTVENLDYEVVQSLVTNALKGKLYLVVLNELWNEDYQKWYELRQFLHVGANGSKIIVITRSQMVAKMTGTVEGYNLLGKHHDEEKSWLLFEKMAFGEEPKSSYQIEVGKEILSFCNGLPILVKMVAAMLSTESSEVEWQMLYETEFRTILKGDFHALRMLCYEHLPSPLKHCFAYCSLYQKGHEYDVQTLIKLWMAQGFIEPQTQDQSLEDAGYGYVLDLLRRGFFLESETDVRERVIKFKMHRSVHRLAMLVAENQCRMLNNSYSDLGANIGRYFHVSLQGLSLLDVLLMQAKNIRSIVLLHKQERIEGNQLLDVVVSRFIFLRSLDMHALGISRVPSSIKKLKLLKYLDLSENEDIVELPSSITQLVNLQTLKLSSCFGLKKLPRGFENLINLRYLEIDGCYNLTTLPRGITQLPNLQMLSQLAVTEDTSPNIGLNRWRKEVHIKNLGYQNFDMKKYLNVISKVKSLSLEWESNAPQSDENEKPLESDDLLLALDEFTLQGFRGKKLFSASCSPSNLVKLSLRRCVNCQILPPLDQLTSLKVLILDELITLKYILDSGCSLGIGTPFFPSLDELWLTELPELRSWWRKEVDIEELPSFPCLSKLVIEDCPALTSMPLFPTLEEGLALDSTCWKPFQLTLNQKTVPQEQEAPSSSTSLPLSKLKALRIVGIEDFQADEIEWRNLKSLQFLRFDCLPNLVSLPERLQHVLSLRELHLWRCGTEEIPEWIGELQNLEKLVISLCPRLKSLPKAIRKLQFLETLEIEECDNLLMRCRKDIGADWKKIRLIKNLRLGKIYEK
ncbi:putative disease resistance protein RGA3 [Humulus lupulus]|uniref:putative disease resistance protein RGA3 n=1 Tax=Humulus lupulus TaxID=3486 RepID=UPI002B415495|nr:putative disease resistance protein RGA3 [Humulus lupulus]